jgi:glycosyltransferase involved in cell wall biosynthesis
VARVKDAGDLAQKICRVLENPASYRKDRSAIRSTFSLERTVEQYLAIYRDALGGAG